MEVILFGLVGALAVVAAMFMITSKNAVHSALFLIINFLCVAFLYLMLEAPFLSMVQIAVYAGAIMVLFLFVIMLLGAENAESDAPKNLKLAIGVPLALAFIFLILAYIVWDNANRSFVDQPELIASGPAMLRFINAAPVANASGESQAEFDRAERRFDVYVNDELVVEDLFLDNVTEFETMEPGEYTVRFSPINTAIPFATATVSLEAGETVSLVLSGADEEEGVITEVAESTTATERNTGRIGVVNVYPGEQAVDVVRITSEQFNDSRTVAPVIENVAPGTTVMANLPEGELDNLAIIQAGAAEAVQNRGGAMNENLIYGRLDEINVVSDTSQLVVVTARRNFDNTLDWRILPTEASTTAASFGSPRSVGERLFTVYALPLQIVAVLLLAAMVGVIILTHRDVVAVPKPSRVLRRKVSRPLTSVISTQTGSDLTSAPQLGATAAESESGD